MNFDRITQYLDSLVAGGVPSVDCIITENHERLYRHYAGTSDHGKRVPIRPDQRYLMFSMTKVMTMTAFMQLVEQGKISLDDEVGMYLPAYRDLKVEIAENGSVGIRDAEKPLKIRYLLSMQSGLDYDLNRPGIRRVLEEKGMKATTRELVDAFTESPLKFEPGTRFLYSLSHDVAAAIIETVSGETFGGYLKKHVWDELGMQHTHFAKPMNGDLTVRADGSDEENAWSLAEQYIYEEQTGKILPMEPSCNYQLSDAYESGGAGLISCTEDYVLLADALSCGGIGANGSRILKPETVDLMKTNLLGEASLRDIETTMGRVGYGYGCGVQVLMDPQKVNSPAPAGVFGWDGAAGSCIIMDNVNHRSLVYTMHVRGYGPAYGQIHPRLRDLMYED